MLLINMKKVPYKFLQQIGIVILIVILIFVSAGWISYLEKLVPSNVLLPEPERAFATYQFTPTGGAIVLGTAPAILGATVAAAEGTNLGSWRATLADDNFHWGIGSTTTGYNVHLDIGNVQLSGANLLMIQTEFDLDATVPSTLVQICDWVSNIGVHHAANAECTTGGWRNLNINDALITTATATAYHWQIYDGYWDATAITSISTPLTNFVGPGNMIRIRFFSTINATSVVHIDHLRVFAVINPVYSASGATQISGAAPLGNYSQTAIAAGGQTGNDAVFFRVPGTATAPSNFFFSFRNVRTWTGANTILVRSDYSCSATGNTHRPSVWNFTTSSWIDLTTASIACATADATNAWAINNINIADFVSGGEVRVGWRTLANGTQEIRVDFIYIMIGTTNTSGTAELTFGTTAAGTVANTQNLDMTGTTATWNILSVDESNTQAFPFYAFDIDHDGTAEEASAANMNFAVTSPTNASVTGIFFAGRFMSGVAGTVQMGLRDYGGITQVTGGWTAIGATATTGLIYTDNITVAGVGSGGITGMTLNPKDHMDTIGNLMNIRLRTTASGAATNNSVAQWDFAMIAIQWVEVPPPPAPITNQSAFRWRNDDGTETTATWRAGENTAITGVVTTEIIRLRMEIEETNSAALMTNARLEFSSDATACTGGTWTALDMTTTAWRVVDSPNITNASATTNQLITSARTFTAGRIFDTQNQDVTGVSLNNSQTEWEWAIRGDGAAANTTFRFRVTNAGTVLGAYTNCAQLTTITAESLTFSLGANSLGLGTLSATAVRTGSHTISLATNASHGMVVTFSGTTLTSGAHMITAMSTTAASSVGIEQFGMNAMANTTPSVGAACSGIAPIASAATG